MINLMLTRTQCLAASFATQLLNAKPMAARLPACVRARLHLIRDLLSRVCVRVCERVSLCADLPAGSVPFGGGVVEGAEGRSTAGRIRHSSNSTIKHVCVNINNVC